MLGKISDQGQPQPLWDLTAVPAEWPLQTVLDAWAAVAGARSNDAAVHRGLRAAEKAVESRLEELWASQPQDAQRWFAQHLELYFQQNLDGWTEEEQLRQVLLEHWDRISHDARSHFSAVGLVAKAWPLGVGWRCPSAPRLLAARGPVEAEAEAEAKRRRLEEASSIKELQAKTEERLRTELVEAQGEATFFRMIAIKTLKNIFLFLFLTGTCTITFAFALAPALALAFGFTFAFNCAVAFAAVACILLFILVCFYVYSVLLCY